MQLAPSGLRHWEVKNMVWLLAHCPSWQTDAVAADTVERDFTARLAGRAAPVREGSIVAAAGLLLGSARLVVIHDRDRIADAALARTVSQITTAPVDHRASLKRERAGPFGPLTVVAGAYLGLARAGAGRGDRGHGEGHTLVFAARAGISAGGFPVVDVESRIGVGWVAARVSTGFPVDVEGAPELRRARGEHEKGSEAEPSDYSGPRTRKTSRELEQQHGAKLSGAEPRNRQP